MRWLVEVAISSFKIPFGDSIHVIRWESAVQETSPTVYIYSRMPRVQRGTIDRRTGRGGNHQTMRA